MQITDPIADLLTRIRNASTAKHPSVEIPASNMKKAICQILVDEGYIKGMQVKNDTVQGTIVVTLKYQANGEPVIAGLRRVSKPGPVSYTHLCKVRQERWQHRRRQDHLRWQREQFRQFHPVCHGDVRILADDAAVLQIGRAHV